MCLTSAVVLPLPTRGLAWGSEGRSGMRQVAAFFPI